MLKEFKDINDKVDNIQKDQQKMMLYLYNDDDTDNKGLIQQVRELKIDVDSLKEKERFRMFRVSTLSSIVGAISGWLLKLIW